MKILALHCSLSLSLGIPFLCTTHKCSVKIESCTKNKLIEEEKQNCNRLRYYYDVFLYVCCQSMELSLARRVAMCECVCGCVCFSGNIKLHQNQHKRSFNCLFDES